MRSEWPRPDRVYLLLKQRMRRSASNSMSRWISRRQVEQIDAGPEFQGRVGEDLGKVPRFCRKRLA